MWPRTTITADRGGIAAGHDVIQGILPDQLAAIIVAATDPLKKLNDAQKATIADLEHRLGASEAQVLMFFRFIGETDVPLDQVGDRLAEIAKRYKTLLIQVESRPGDDPAVARLKTEAHAALEAGDFDCADALLEKVLAAQDAASAQRQLEAAATSAQRGDIALTRLRYFDAAKHFAAAVDRVPLGHEEDLADYGNRRAEALYRYGDEKADNAVLLQAIDVLKALQERTGERMPPKWDEETHRHLNMVRHMLGERAGDRLLLQEAQEGFRLLLENPKADREPLQQVSIRVGTDSVRLTLAKLEGGTTQLYRTLQAARDELQSSRGALLGAGGRIMAFNHLGIVAAECGERDSGPRGTALLEEAVQAFRSALDLRGIGLPGGVVQASPSAFDQQIHKQAPRSWATIRMHLGNALSSLGTRDNGPKGTEQLKEAVAACRAALQELTRERVPLDWAAVQTNLGNALLRLDARESGTARLEEAVQAYRAALEELTRERVRLEWAAVQTNLGIALLELGVRIQDRAKLEEAREAVSGAFNVYMQDGQEHRRSGFEDLLRQIDAALAEVTEAPPH
jgi:tetratricopeptide (TPR) repeat protein